MKKRKENKSNILHFSEHKSYSEVQVVDMLN